MPLKLVLPHKYLFAAQSIKCICSKSMLVFRLYENQRILKWKEILDISHLTFLL